MTSATARFVKGHGAHNDFVLVEDHDGALDLRPEQVARLAERTGGLGADGVIRVVRTSRAMPEAPDDAPEWFMDYRNADGSLAEMCGNGTRVFAAHLAQEGLIGTEAPVQIWTRAGRRTVQILGRPAPEDPQIWEVRTGMGPARIDEDAGEVRIQERSWPVLSVNMGNPHRVAMLSGKEDLASLDLTAQPVLDPLPDAGANIEFVQLRGDHHVAMRVHERGSGETLACGTGACAAAIAAARAAGALEDPAPWRVDLPGGTLSVAWDEIGSVFLSGPAELVAEGTVRL